MLGRATGAVLLGVEAHLVQVEVNLGGGLPSIAAVGLPDAAVREGIDRIRAALPCAGFSLPQRRVIVNLAPAEIRKHGTALDLPMAFALLAADGQVRGLEPSTTLMAGELSLDGGLRPVRGILAMALEARAAGRRNLIVPLANAEEASLVPELRVFPVAGLADLRRLGQTEAHRAAVADAATFLAQTRREIVGPDLSEVRGQRAARRGLEVAAAGGHHLLLRGPPGAGKSMLARRLPGILPTMRLDEALEVTRIWSAAGLARGLVTRRPFRAPHHSASAVGLTGGGRVLRPGEMTLACHGVLYLDELPEFRRDVLEALRQPLEDGAICIVRVHTRLSFPARFALVASMNPCPCGFHGQPDGRCGCSSLQIRRYLGKLSGPLLDRFDLVIDVPPVGLEALRGLPDGESSADVRERVERARARHSRRFADGGPVCNARLGPHDLERHARLSRDAETLLLSACRRLRLSARGFDRIRRVARTIADLEAQESIGAGHIAEALQYRPPATAPGAP